MIEGERIGLRPIELTDVTETYRTWMNDPEVTRYTESRFQTHSLADILAYVQSVQADPSSVFFAIVDKETGRHAGNLKIGHMHPVHRNADVGLIIGDRACWGRGFATEALKLAAKYAEETLKLHKLWAGIYADNIGSITAFRRAGFVEEGRFAKHWLSDGQYVDGVQMGLLLGEKS